MGLDGAWHCHDSPLTSVQIMVKLTQMGVLTSFHSSQSALTRLPADVCHHRKMLYCRFNLINGVDRLICLISQRIYSNQATLVMLAATNWLGCILALLTERRMCGKKKRPDLWFCCIDLNFLQKTFQCVSDNQWRTLVIKFTD